MLRKYMNTAALGANTIHKYRGVSYARYREEVRRKPPKMKTHFLNPTSKSVLCPGNCKSKGPQYQQPPLLLNNHQIKKSCNYLRRFFTLFILFATVPFRYFF